MKPSDSAAMFRPLKCCAKCGAATNEETENLTNLALDNKDDDGTPLNEKGITEDRSGADLDVPGSELDNDNEDIGEGKRQKTILFTADGDVCQHYVEP